MACHSTLRHATTTANLVIVLMALAYAGLYSRYGTIHLSFMPIYTSAERIAALRIVQAQNGEQTTGIFTQLPGNASFVIIDEGSTNTTVKVNYDGSEYLVFREDIRGRNQRLR